MKNTTEVLLLTLLVLVSCSEVTQIDLKEEHAESKELEVKTLPYTNAFDTIYFNQNLRYLDKATDDNFRVIGNWFKMDSDSNSLYYVLCEKDIRDYTYIELKVFNYQNREIHSLTLADTAYVLKSPQNRFSRAFRSSNWIYIQSGIMHPDSSTSITKEHKIDAWRMLDRQQ